MYKAKYPMLSNEGFIDPLDKYDIVRVNLSFAEAVEMQGVKSRRRFRISLEILSFAFEEIPEPENKSYRITKNDIPDMDKSGDGMREKIKAFVIYNDGIESETREDDKGNWCPKKEVRELEADYNKLLEDREILYQRSLKDIDLREKLDIAIEAFNRILNSDDQPYDFIYKTLEKIE